MEGRKNVSLLRRTFALLCMIACVLSVVLPVGYCAIDTSTITEWLPTIIEFAMLGMVMGLLKKFGKW